MLSISAWLGNLVPSGASTRKVRVYAKLSGKCLGLVDKPIESCGQAFDAIRRLQDQVALLLPHEYLPSRYLLLFVGNQGLLPRNFPFCDKHSFACKLDTMVALEQLKQRIDVMYDEDYVASAATSLNDKQLCVKMNMKNGALYVRTRENFRTLHALVTRELEAWTFRRKITALVLWHSATLIGRLDMFPDLSLVEVGGIDGGVHKVDFESLATKKLATLRLQLLNHQMMNHPKRQTTLLGVGNLTSLTELEVHFVQGGEHDIQQKEELPPDIKLLTNLRYLYVQGPRLCGFIPKELGSLTNLVTLMLTHSSLSGSVPSELGQLSKLRELDLTYNPYLTGELPEELNRLDELKHFYVRGTPSLNTYTFLRRAKIYF